LFYVINVWKWLHYFKFGVIFSQKNQHMWFFSVFNEFGLILLFLPQKLSWIIYVFENHLKWDRKISLWAVVINKILWLKRFKICETLCVGRNYNWPKKAIPQKICLWHFYWHKWFSNTYMIHDSFPQFLLIFDIS
jgi:hypothetical protein